MMRHAPLVVSVWQLLTFCLWAYWKYFRIYKLGRDDHRTHEDDAHFENIGHIWCLHFHLPYFPVLGRQVLKTTDSIEFGARR